MVLNKYQKFSEIQAVENKINIRNEVSHLKRLKHLED
jgi:hypothetical protein